ncbi:MAG: hypothetical protein M1821_005937 [Bathelium mastoideum]|nr:MAG: hypothetical protein M1821_005937 [Bathelium mastoideum]KAI9688523.1 MAG: hypothetical protein M1822_001472 [Bathelium mastoideum]
MGRLDGKVALVTGAGSGFGEAMAKAFTRESASVIVADIDAKGGQRVVKEIEDAKNAGKAAFLSMDCTKEHAWSDALQFAKEHMGQLDIVCNNAGTTYKKKPSIEVTEQEFDKIINVNVKSIYLSTAVIMPYFVERRSGVYLNTSSVAGTRVRPGQVFYGGTKGFLSKTLLHWRRCVSLRFIPPDTVTQGLAAEYGPFGIRVNSVCPLRGTTALLELFSGVPDSPEERARFAQTVPLRRQSEPKDVASAAVFLVSDEAEFITGVNMPVDGGRLAV